MPADTTAAQAPRKRHPFKIPLTSRLVMALTLAAAFVSIARMRPMYELIGQNDFTTYRALRVDSMFADLYPRYDNRRVVFFDGVEWRSNTTIAKTMHPVQLRQVPANSSNTDLTRYYQVGSSKDYPKMERRRWPHHEFDPNCIPSAAWQSNFYPICNEIHATTNLLEALTSGKLSLLSNKGFWRHAWRYDQALESNTTNATVPAETTVWKTFKINHNFEEKYYEDNRVDAVAMERLTASPYVISMYGFCGLTVIQEFAGRELAQVMDKLKMNSTERLKLAKKITVGLQDIQHIPTDDGSTEQPTMVHNDLNLANLVFTEDGRPVWNDFNIAILLMKHNETGEQCPFYSHFPNPQWKSPEEQVDNDEESDSHPPIVNEKIDMYALGNVFYRMIAGGSPWKRPEAKKLFPDEKIVVAKLKRYNGTQPSIPEHILANATESNDPALASLLKAMYDCYSFKAKDRPTTGQLISFFDDAIARVEKFNTAKALNSTRSKNAENIEASSFSQNQTFQELA